MFVEPGIYKGVHRPVYDAIVALRSSDGRRCEDADSMELLIKERFPTAVEKLFIPDESDKEALEFGNLVHERVLERKRPWAVLPEINRRTKEGKELYQRYVEACEGKKVVPNRGKRTTLSRQRLVGCSRSVLNLIQKEYGPKWRERADTELCLIWNQNGQMCKCLLDTLIDDDVLDIKSVGVWPKNGRFLSHIAKFNYEFPVKHYLNGCEAHSLPIKRYRWLFVESCYPFRARFVDCPFWVLENLDALIEKCVKNYQGLEDFVPPTSVELQIENWWMYRHGEEVQLEGVEEYEE